MAMNDSEQLANKAAYEAVREDGQIAGAIGPRDWSRFRQTLKFIPKDTQSFLDAGCDRGHWLDYITRQRRITTHLGIDISEGRIEEAKNTYPHLHLMSGYLEQLDIPTDSYEVVTSLEVLEHIPDWLTVLKSLLIVARKRVVITVPYRESIQHTICIHCGNIAPMYGHLRRYDENTFPSYDGWRLSFGYIKDYGIGASKLRRIYRTLFPLRAWLVACYDTQRE